MLKPVVFLALAALNLGAQTYEIDTAHSGASFSVKHMMVTNVSGRFSNVKGKVTYDEKNLAKSAIEATLDVATVNTNDAKRDAHLKTPDFFDAEKYPTMTFKSTRFYKQGATLMIDGTLTLHGVTRPVTLTVEELSGEVKHPAGTIVRGAVAKTKINRKDYGLTYNKVLDTGGVMIGEEIAITLEIELSRKPA
jgi:polyisoprenoid-binding protein YceI